MNHILVSNVISSHVSETVVRGIDVNENTEAAKLTRSFYKSVVDRFDWKQQLMNVIQQVKNDTQSQLDGENEINSEEYSLYVGVNGESGGEFTIGDCFIIGQKQGVDVICNSSDVSRVHVFVFVTQNKIVVLDYFSLHGTKCVSRSSSEELSSSLETGRRPMIFDLDEAFVLQVAQSTKIKFSTKHCLICLTSPREVRFPKCHHSAVCNSCQKHVTHCPLCREPVGNNVLVSNCVKTYAV